MNLGITGLRRQIFKYYTMISIKSTVNLKSMIIIAKIFTIESYLRKSIKMLNIYVLF